MNIIKKTGFEIPCNIRYERKLGMRQYTVIIDIQEINNAEQLPYYRWAEVTFDTGAPSYADVVAAIIQCRYPQNDMQAIINNYLLNDDNEEHEKEWHEMQQWRTIAKRKAKELLDEIKA